MKALGLPLPPPSAHQLRAAHVNHLGDHCCVKLLASAIGLGQRVLLPSRQGRAKHHPSEGSAGRTHQGHRTHQGKRRWQDKNFA